MDLTTRFHGLDLPNPFVIGASPLADDPEMVRRLEDAGVAALVMRSFFEEQRDRPGALGPMPEAGLPEYADYQRSVDAYGRHLERLKRSVAIPIVASLNGHHPDSWIDVAPQIERAGADAIELNFYQVVADAAIGADQVEMQMIETLRAVVRAVRIPVGAKLSPFHASVAQVGVALELAGADGLVVFNRFYQPDIDVRTIQVHPQLRLSEPGELLLRLRWLAILSPLLRIPIAATGGVHDAEGVVKALLAGAGSVQLVSEILQQGPAALGRLREGLEEWMHGNGCRAISDFRGRLDHRRSPDSSAYERANYIRVLQSWRDPAAGRRASGG